MTRAHLARNAPMLKYMKQHQPIHANAKKKATYNI